MKRGKINNMKKLSELVGIEGLKEIMKKDVELYYNLINKEKFQDEYNKYKNIKVLEIEEKPLSFIWTLCKVEVERCGRNLVEYLSIRDYGARGSFGFEVMKSLDGYSYSVCDIDYDREIRTFGYNSGNVDLLKDYCKLLKIVKAKN